MDFFDQNPEVDNIMLLNTAGDVKRCNAMFKRFSPFPVARSNISVLPLTTEVQGRRSERGLLRISLTRMAFFTPALVFSKASRSVAS